MIILLLLSLFFIIVTEAMILFLMKIEDTF